jgi:hypothetical protein
VNLCAAKTASVKPSGSQEASGSRARVGGRSRVGSLARIERDARLRAVLRRLDDGGSGRGLYKRNTSHAVAWSSELCESHVHHQLALRRMTGNMSLACNVLRQHHAPCGESADIAVTRFKFNLAGEPKHEQTLRRVMPIYLAHTGGYAADIEPRSREIV